MDQARRSRCRARRTASTGSHILSYAATPQGTEANALYGTPDEICRTLEALQAAGVEYVILTLLGGTGAVAAVRARHHAGFRGQRRRGTPRAVNELPA